VDTGLRPANFIRDSDAGDRFHEYPKLKELASRKDERIAERATPPTSKRVDLRDFDLTSLGTKFDVILIDPPWDEYRRRKAAVGGLMEGAAYAAGGRAAAVTRVGRGAPSQQTSAAAGTDSPHTCSNAFPKCPRVLTSSSRPTT